MSATARKSTAMILHQLIDNSAGDAKLCCGKRLQSLRFCSSPPTQESDSLFLPIQDSSENTLEDDA